jgi:hypothetical protein
VTNEGDDFWRKRADEARVAAEGVTHPALKRELLQVAADFERLASCVRERKLRWCHGLNDNGATRDLATPPLNENVALVLQ